MKLNKQKGFTLIELMIVLAIIGIISAVAIPSYQENLRDGRKSVAKGDLLNLAGKIEVYRQGMLSYNGATSALYSATSPVDADPHYNLNVVVTGGGTGYLLNADAIPGTAAENDGIFWFNPTGRNCHFPAAGTAYNDACAGGITW